MQLEEGPFFIIKDYRKIVGKAKSQKKKQSILKGNEFTTHQCIPQDIKDQINQILFQLTQPQRSEDENRQKMNDDEYYMDEQAYFYFQKREQQKRDDANQQITQIDHFLSLEEKQTL